jgi:SAM-dependent methyltransferase
MIRDFGGEGASDPYALRRDGLPEALRERAVELAEDEEARAFLAGPGARPHGRVATWLRRAAGAVLSDYDANAWLGFHELFLLSVAQWGRLLGRAPGAPPAGRLLDIGAGSGDVGARLWAHFASVVCTETSSGMARRLRARGVRACVVDLALAPLPSDAGGPFEAVALLNVLDRCARPRSLLRAAAAQVAPGGRVIVATPLPLSPHVHVPGGTVDADEPLPRADGAFEAMVAAFVRDVLAPAGLRVERLARAPYRSRGDAHAPLYELDDAVLVCQRE